MLLSEYRNVLATRIQNDRDFWNVTCSNWFKCGSSESHYVVADSYFPTIQDAENVGVEYGMRVCRNCFQSNSYASDQVIADRNAPLLPPKKTRLVVTPDTFNNVGRACNNLSTADSGRHWIIRHCLRDEQHNRFYLVENRITGERRIELAWSLTNMY